MAFDTYNALIFKALADRRGVDDNRIMLVAGLSTGSPLMKMLIPFQMLQQAEEKQSTDSSLENSKKRFQESIKDIRIIADGDGNSEEKLEKIKQKIKEKSNGVSQPV